jgi:hypothetical protein
VLATLAVSPNFRAFRKAAIGGLVGATHMQLYRNRKMQTANVDASTILTVTT